MSIKKLLIGFISLISIFALTACTGENEGTSPDNSTEVENNSGTKENSDAESNPHVNMDHSSSGEVPDELEVAESPTYPEGSQAVMNASHMEGMDKAVATIEGAYDTTVYSVTYTPTNGGEKVENHKWVIHEELENAEEEPYQPGGEVVLNADHMEGMEGATAVVDSAQKTTVYMVTYSDTETGEEVTNHKWVTESELSPTE